MPLDDYTPQARRDCARAVQSALSHLEARDVPALLCDLRDLRELFVYSDYEFYHAWNEAKPRIVRLLWESLPFEAFVEFYGGRNFYGFHIWSDLDEVVDGISVSQLQILCERFRFPHPRTAPRSVAKLASAPDVQLTPWLNDWINAYFERHRYGVLRDIYVFSCPLSGALRILAQRYDAVEICAQMLRERHFGTVANSPNCALLDGLGDQNTEESRRALRQLARNGIGPSDFRLNLLAKIARFAPREALGEALSDLNQAQGAATIEAILRWLWHQAEVLQNAAREVEPKVDFFGWNAVSRATLADTWAQKFAFWPLTTSFPTRFILRIARHLHRLRELNPGCLTLLFGFPILGALWLWFLNSCVGVPAYGVRWVEPLPFVAWTDLVLLFIIWPIFTGGQIWQGPHGMESVRENWESALAFYGGTLAFLLGTLLVRLHWPF